MSEGRVEVRREGPVAVVTLDRPSRKNALDLAMWEALAAAFGEVAADLPRVAIVTGAGETFCAGMDVNPDNPLLGGVMQATQEQDVEAARAVIERLRAIFDSWRALPIPTIAAINGPAIGGGLELALHCDIRVADPAAFFSLPEVQLGWMPDLGGTVLSTRLLGPGVAADLILSARKLSAEEALRVGLISRVTEPGQALQESLALAEQIGQHGPRAVRAATEVIRSTPGRPFEEAYAHERAKAERLLVSGEWLAGVQARMQKQPANWPEPD